MRKAKKNLLLIAPRRERKSDNYHYCNSWKRVNFRENNKDKGKNIHIKMKQRRLGKIYLHEAN